jgi:hypothetical protein
MEPTIVYDKSTIQMLTREEASWFGHFFRGVMTPVFMMEVLGNLAKDFEGRMRPDEGVAAFADKTDHFHTVANISHVELIEANLLGYEVEMKRVPVLGGGKVVRATNGETGIFFEESAEARALRRWGDRDFLAAERELAANWRTRTRGLDLSAVARTVGFSGEQLRAVDSLEQVFEALVLYFNDDGARHRALSAALEMFDVPLAKQTAVISRWYANGCPPLRRFAPYAFYALMVTQLFMLGLSLRLIPDRPTNAVDIQYLYYLPFCMVFTSGGKLHRELAKFFLQSNQTFVWAKDLKTALQSLVFYYGERADELKQKGRAHFARYPPLDLQTSIHEAYDVTTPEWRLDAAQPQEELTPEQRAAIMAKLGR